MRYRRPIFWLCVFGIGLGSVVALLERSRSLMPERGRDVEPDFEAFCDCLNRHQVEYVIVGSEAVAEHGVPRYSQDFDTFIRATRENASRLVAALTAAGPMGRGSASRLIILRTTQEKAWRVVMGQPVKKTVIDG
jgi:hypothetical protein